MRRLINVCGASRSGTTMIDLMLGNAPDAFSCGEVYAWFRPFRAHHFTLACGCGEKPCSRWQQIQEGPEQSFHGRVLERLKVETVIDSSKDICWVIANNRWAAEQGIAVTNLLVWKEPAALSYSYWKRGGGANMGRAEFIEYYGRFLATGLPFIALSYDELTQAPATKLRQLCERIGIDYFAGKERFWEHPSHHLFGSSGTRSQLGQEESEIRGQDPLPPDFLAALREQGIDFATDDAVCKIVRRLEEREVSRMIGSAAETEPASRLHRVTMPTWCYVEQIRRSVKRAYLRTARAVGIAGTRRAAVR